MIDFPYFLLQSKIAVNPIRPWSGIQTTMLYIKMKQQKNKQKSLITFILNENFFRFIFFSVLLKDTNNRYIYIFFLDGKANIKVLQHRFLYHNVFTTNPFCTWIQFLLPKKLIVSSFAYNLCVCICLLPASLWMLLFMLLNCRGKRSKWQLRLTTRIYQTVYIYQYRQNREINVKLFDIFCYGFCFISLITDKPCHYQSQLSSCPR